MVTYHYWIDDRFILREIKFSGSIITKTPLRIGAGREAVSLKSLIDLPVIRRAGTEEPYIPGTSLKGVFRSTSERLARIKSLKVCTGLSKQTCMDQKYGENTLLEWFNEKRKIAREHHELYDEILKVIFDKTCLNCKIFGSPGISSRLIFFDCEPANPNSYRIFTRKGIAVSRYSGSSVALYEVEYIEPGSVFIFKLWGKNLPNYAIGLIAKVIEEINKGRTRIGGFKTRGFGQVYIKLERLDIATYDGSLEVMKPLDNFDKEVDVKPGSYASEQVVWDILRRFIEVWDNVNFVGRKV